MRCDLLLSRLCLYKTRSQAARACDEGRVRLNGLPARPSREVKPGDRLAYLDPLGIWRTEVEVLALPGASVSKAAAREMVRVLAHEKTGDPWTDEGGG
jgi:ribosome-associated heat shock protein Hsp15